MTDKCRCLRVPKSIGRRLSFRSCPFISVLKISLVTDRWQAGPTPYPYQSKESLFCEGFFPSRVFTWGRLLCLARLGDITVCHSRTTCRHHNMSLRAHLMSLKRCVVILGIKKLDSTAPAPCNFTFLFFSFQCLKIRLNQKQTSFILKETWLSYWLRALFLSQAWKTCICLEYGLV